MSPKSAPEQLIAEIAQRKIDRLVRQTVDYLQAIRSTLSGDDSGLRDAWDEICVQVQFHESASWEAYEATVNQFVEGAVQELAPIDLRLLWLQTDAGWAWLYDHRDTTAEIPAETESVVDLLMQAVRDKAGDWSNTRIRRYLDRPSSD